MPSPIRKVGPYEIVRQIGRGGMAIVYLARQTTLDRDVALKELSTFHASAPEMAERFLRESRLAGSLNHPNIVTVLEYFEHGGTPYIAMEYVPRGSLRPYVGSLSFAQLAGVMEGVLAGLAHAGGYGIVHRDLKPENIMVTADGRVKIADFGIAKATQSAGTGAFLTATGTTVGTPTYMAPEQAMAQDIGLWTDLYSVGVMAWEHVVGRVPFHDTEAPMVILMRHVNEQIPPAVEVSPGADAELSAWIDRLLVKDPAKRTRDPVSAWDELEEIVIGRLGPRWRREARLPSYSAVIDTPRPLTPAPFQSQRAKTPEPTMRPADAPPEAPAPDSPAAETPPAATPAAQADSGYLTFGPGSSSVGAPPETESTAPEQVAPTPVAPEPVAPEPVEPEPVAPEPAGETSSPAVASSTQIPAVEPASPSTRSEDAPLSETSYVTFAGTPGAEPKAPPQPPPPPPAPPAAPMDTGPAAEAVPAPEAAPAAETPAADLTLPSSQTPPALPSPPPPAARVPDPRPAPEARSAPEPPVRSPEPEMATPMSVTQPSAVTPSVPSPPTRRKAGKVSGPAALVAVVGVIAAAVVGFAIAPSSGSSPHATPLAASASVGPIELSFPSGWRRQSRPRTPSVKLANELAVGPATGGVVAVGFATPTDATLLPSSLKSALPSRPTQQVISLGNAQVYRYPGLVVSGGSGGSGAAYALPTSVGTLVGMCLPTAGAANFLGQCEQVLGSLRLTSGRVLALGPSSSFAGELSGVIKQLNTAVGAGGSRLQSAGKPAAQVSAANDLAGAYARAARAIKGLRAGPATTAVAPLISALGRTGSAYTALGRAVAHNDARGYAAASRSIGTASTELAAAFSQLAKLGYVSG